MLKIHNLVSLLKISDNPVSLVGINMWNLYSLLANIGLPPKTYFYVNFNSQYHQIQKYGTNLSTPLEDRASLFVLEVALSFS